MSVVDWILDRQRRHPPTATFTKEQTIRRILDTLHEYGPQTTDELALALTTLPEDLQPALDELLARGLLIRFRRSNSDDIALTQPLDIHR